jgi:hypothetical protein
MSCPLPRNRLAPDSGVALSVDTERPVPVDNLTFASVARHGGSERRRSRRRLLRLRVFERLAKLGVLTLQVANLAFEPDDLELRHA